MKKLWIFLIALALGSFSACYAVKTVVISPLVQSGIAKYKAKNYLGAKLDIEKAVGMNPKDSMAQYYLGNIYTAIGKKDEAKNAYEEVARANDNPALVKYAKFALGCIEKQGDENSGGGASFDPNQQQEAVVDPCDKKILGDPNIDPFIKSGQFLHNDAKNKIQENQLKGIQSGINAGSKSVEFSNYRYLNDAGSEIPSDKEIADAVKTLAKVGFNPLAMNNIPNGGGYNNPQYNQLSAMMGGAGNQGNSTMNMLPFIMGQGGEENRMGKFNPQLIQSMMMNQLMPSYDFSDSNNNRGY